MGDPAEIGAFLRGADNCALESSGFEPKLCSSYLWHT